MELLAFFAVLLLGGIFVMWRSRSGNTSWRESRLDRLPDDLRKNQTSGADTPAEREPTGSEVVGTGGLGGTGGFGGYGGGTGT